MHFLTFIMIVYTVWKSQNNCSSLDHYLIKYGFISTATPNLSDKKASLISFRYVDFLDIFPSFPLESSCNTTTKGEILFRNIWCNNSSFLKFHEIFRLKRIKIKMFWASGQVVWSRKYPLVGGAKIFCRFVYEDLQLQILIYFEWIIWIYKCVFKS